MSNQTTRPKLAVEIDGTRVTLEFSMADHYAAIKFYEDVCASARDGLVLVDVEIANVG